MPCGELNLHLLLFDEVLTSMVCVCVCLCELLTTDLFHCSYTRRLCKETNVFLWHHVVDVVLFNAAFILSQFSVTNNQTPIIPQ